jgi:hypothetical protein
MRSLSVSGAKRSVQVLIILFLFLFTGAAYSNGLEGCEEYIKYGAPSLEPVLLCRVWDMPFLTTQFIKSRIG